MMKSHRGFAACLIAFAAITSSLSAQDYFAQQASSQEAVETSFTEAIDLSNDQPVVLPSAVSSLDKTIAAQPCSCSSCTTKAPCNKKCGGGCCDCKKKKAAAKKAAGAYKIVFYANDFSYLCDPCYGGHHIGEALKRRGIGCNWTIDVGGQYRARYHHEDGMRGTPGQVNSFLLHRTRLYANIEYADLFRVYAEGIDAVSNYEILPPRGIDENRSDLLNAFIDINLWKTCGGGRLYTRVGRQELLYGAQRWVSVLDWANTRRTFEGAKVGWTSKKWDIDGFWANPMTKRTLQFDVANKQQEFFGLYSTYKGRENEKIDFYYLGYNNLGAFDYDTFGARWQGSKDGWLWDCEAAYQSGLTGAANHQAGAWTAGFGRKWDCWCWKPQLFLYYDWASGSDIPNNGFHHMFPLAHKYLGFMDFFGRRNIETPNMLLTMQPHKKVKLLMWYYCFFRQNRNDTPYDVVMNSYGTANGSRHLGHEIDTAITLTLTPRSQLVLGYSHFFAGAYYNANPTLPNSGGADFVWTQFHVNF